MELTYTIEEYRFSLIGWKVDWYPMRKNKSIVDEASARNIFNKLSRDAYKYRTGEKYRVVNSEGGIVVEDKL